MSGSQLIAGGSLAMSDEEKDFVDQSSFVVADAIVEKQKNINDIQNEILFDNRLKMKAKLRKGVKPNE
jgi:hypothetical protein